ncbi:hypothetical protein I3760_09G166100 [Carya illinoinensis]|nr:hypothetical protein I3760_09G166100 [Carya illinoinensis]
MKPKLGSPPPNALNQPQTSSNHPLPPRQAVAVTDVKPEAEFSKPTSQSFSSSVSQRCPAVMSRWTAQKVSLVHSPSASRHDEILHHACGKPSSTVVVLALAIVSVVPYLLPHDAKVLDLLSLGALAISPPPSPSDQSATIVSDFLPFRFLPWQDSHILSCIF